MEEQITQLEKLNNKLSNERGYKFEYIKAISAHKELEPEDNDPEDYEEEYEEENEEGEMETKSRLISVPKPHAEWQKQLENFEDGLMVCRNRIADLEGDIDDLEEILVR